MTKFSIILCQICAHDAHGTHFGVKTCRACAAFFRRYAKSKWVNEKCTRKNVDPKKCLCRPCRLQKCLQNEMSTKKFQYGRESITTVPPTLSAYLGRPEFLIFCDPQPFKLKTYIDIHNLLSEASRILDSGCEAPIFDPNLSGLKKLSLGAHFLRLDPNNIKVYGRFGKMEFIDVSEYYFLTVIKWILRFDEFQKLDRSLQMTLLHSFWHVWMKFQKCSATAMFRKTNMEAKRHQKILRNVCMDRVKSQMDTTWMSDYPDEYVMLYIRSQHVYEADVIEHLEKLNPTDVELTYMFAQTCFEYAGKRYQGEILKITDRFQQILSYDLHVYYIVEEKNSRYFKRLAELMKVNNLMQHYKNNQKMMKISKPSCQICGQDSHGLHFGVRSCRACAAFFRRYAHSKWVIAKCTKKRENINGAICFCRPCRLQKCLKSGMDTTKFQYDRDSISRNPPILHTPSSFFGRPEFLMYCDPQESPSIRAFIDVQYLLSEASRLLDSGSETPIYNQNQLQKLSLGASFLKLDTSNMKFYGNFGKVEFIDIIEYYFITVVKWVLRFDEFQNLDRSVQMTLLNSIWHVFMKFHKCSATAMFRKANQNARPHQKVLRNVCMDSDKAQMDTSWLSDYPHEYINLYMRSQNIYESEAIEEIEKLNPTDVELTYMFAQTCFEYAGNRYQGEILKITDRFQQILSDDLHLYYTEEERNPRYLKRLAELMKVNNLIQRSIWEGRPQRELGRVFNVLKVAYSHPEIFEDSAFCSSI